MQSWEKPLGGLLARLGLDSIRNKILVLALLATLIPAVSTAALSYVRTRSALTDTLETELRGTASQSARELDLWVKERFYDLRIFVGSFEVTENLDRIVEGGPASTEALDRLTDYLTVVQERFGEYAGLVVVDEEARPVAAGEGAATEPAVSPDWIAALRRGETQLGATYWDESLDATLATMAVPIQSADGRFLGVLVATLTFDPFQEILAGLSPGSSGRVEILSADGRVVVASEPVSGFEPALPEETLASLAAAGGRTVEYRTPDGVEMVGALTGIAPLGWSVLSHLPSDEAYAPVARLTSSTIVLVTVLLIVVGTIAYFIGLFITRPLARLAEGAGAVAEGDLSVDLPVTGRDEVGYLTEVFNGMVARLRANAEKLDEAHTVLRAQNAELEQISVTDGLTSLFNRRYLVDEFEKEIGRASRHGRPLAVLMMDVDRFKDYNDTFGHQAGDEVLAALGQVLRDATRDADIPARYGGEEFIILLPDCDIEGAVETGERIRKRLGEEVFKGRKITVSIGAAAYPAHGETTTAVVASADTALYEAKRAGRNRVVAAGEG